MLQLPEDPVWRWVYLAAMSLFGIWASLLGCYIGHALIEFVCRWMGR